MLLAVNGGPFFPSVLRYNKGLTLLEKRPMRVLPWNQYQLVEQKSFPDFQLASRTKRAPRGCTSFRCFNRASAGADVPAPLKVDHVPQSAPVQDPCVHDRSKECTVSGSGESETEVSLKSSLKKQVSRCSSIGRGDGDHACNSRREVQRNASFTQRRKVRWTDSCGRELVEILEFEPSDDGSSDDDFENERSPRCECVIQ